MSRPETKQNTAQPAPQQTNLAAGARIDPAHPAGSQEVPAGGEPSGAEAVAPQLRTQAAQLAAHLRHRQKELDHREAQVNARIAHLERDTRTARLWLAEREAELDQRSEEPFKQHHQVQKRTSQSQAPDTARKQAQLKAKAEELAKQANALRHQRQQVDARREASLQLIRQLHAGLKRHRRAVEAHAEKLRQHAGKPSPELLDREEALRGTAEALQCRGRALDEAESRLSDAQTETQELCGQLRQARQEALEEGRRERRRLVAEQRRRLADLEKQRKAVGRRSEHVDRCRGALEQLRSELGRMHRETLEIRLATEELWVQLSGAAPPAALTRSLGRIRSKLADHYRLADAELCEQKKELESIRGQLTEQYEKLVEQKKQFEQWVARRQEETQQQAQRLVAREEQLHGREAELSDQAHRCGAERLEYQEEIRRLQSQLAERETVMA